MPAFFSNDLAIVEPTDGYFLSGKGIVAKAIVHADNKVPLRLINLANETKKLYSGMYVAMFIKFSAVKICQTREASNSLVTHFLSISKMCMVS